MRAFLAGVVLSLGNARLLSVVRLTRLLTQTVRRSFETGLLRVGKIEAFSFIFSSYLGETARVFGRFRRAFRGWDACFILSLFG